MAGAARWCEAGSRQKGVLVAPATPGSSSSTCRSRKHQQQGKERGCCIPTAHISSCVDDVSMDVDTRKAPQQPVETSPGARLATQSLPLPRQVIVRREQAWHWHARLLAAGAAPCHPPTHASVPRGLPPPAVPQPRPRAQSSAAQRPRVHPGDTPGRGQVPQTHWVLLLLLLLLLLQL
jgi:hypothetical protein